MNIDLTPKKNCYWHHCIAICLAALTILALTPSQASAQASLSIVNTPGFPGGDVDLPVLMRQIENLSAAQFDVIYNPAKVTASGIASSLVLSNHVVRSRELAPGILRVLVFSRKNESVNATSPRSISQIPFTVSPNERVSSGPIMLANAQLSQANASPISPLALHPGSIFVQAIHVQADGAQLFLPSESGARYVIEATSDFLQWSEIATNTALGNYLDFFDADATNYTHRFYRSRRDP